MAFLIDFLIIHISIFHKKIQGSFLKCPLDLKFKYRWRRPSLMEIEEKPVENLKCFWIKPKNKHVIICRHDKVQTQFKFTKDTTEFLFHGNIDHTTSTFTICSKNTEIGSIQPIRHICLLAGIINKTKYDFSI